MHGIVAIALQDLTQVDEAGLRLGFTFHSALGWGTEDVEILLIQLDLVMKDGLSFMLQHSGLRKGGELGKITCHGVSITMAHLGRCNRVWSGIAKNNGHYSCRDAPGLRAGRSRAIGLPERCHMLTISSLQEKGLKQYGVSPYIPNLLREIRVSPVRLTSNQR